MHDWDIPTYVVRATAVANILSVLSSLYGAGKLSVLLTPQSLATLEDLNPPRIDGIQARYAFCAHRNRR